jgi:choice-of-anchor A domain-containing protein
MLSSGLRLGGFFLLGIVVFSATGKSARADTLYDGFDLVVFGSMSGQGDVEGKAIIGGALGGDSADFATKLTGQPASNVNLYIGGSISSGENLDNGSAIIGTNSTEINHNQSGSTVTQNDLSAVTSVLTPLESTLKSASATFAAESQSSNATIATSGSNSTLSATGPLSGSTIVFDVTSSSLFMQNAGITLSGALAKASEIVINVDVTSSNHSLDIGSSIHFSSDTTADLDALDSEVVWNFYQTSGAKFDTADTLNLQTDTDFAGAILAPYAAFKNTTPVEGSVAVASYTQQGEIHLPVSMAGIPNVPILTGGTPIPTPKSLWMAAAGCAGIIFARRRAGAR